MAKPRVVNKLPQFTASVKVKGARGMTQALILGASEASVLTPIDTSMLLNSQFRNVAQQGEKIVGTVGYTARYAPAVHDPDVEQAFRRATAKKEFLKLGMEAAEPSIRAVLSGVLRT